MNIVIKNSAWTERDLDLLFGDDNGREEIVFAESDEMGALMRELGVFESASAARRAGREGPVPAGWTDNFKASKKVRIWIWNPTE